MSEVIFNVKTIIKKLKDILKCDLCKNLFDYNNHIPLITKTGETYCKQCFLSNSKNINIKSKSNTDNLDKKIGQNNFVENLKIKLIIKEILNIYDKTISEKYIVFSKQMTERNNNNPRYGHYLLTYNNSTTGIKDNSSNDYVYNNSNKKINNQKKSFLNNIKNVNNQKKNINNNKSIDKNEKTENNKNNDNNSAIEAKNSSKIISKEIALKTTTNNKNINNNKNNEKNNNNINVNISDFDDNLNTLVFSDEMKINDNFLEANENNNMKNIDDDSIETIPINDEKSTVNMSFKNEFNEFLVKNDNFQTEITNQKELKNDVNKYIFINKNNFIYKNNPKISGSSLNIKKKNETNINKDKDVKCSEEKKYLYQLSEPNFENISANKLKTIFNELENKNINKEEEKSSNKNINENEIKKIYKNTNYYDISNKKKFKNNSINDNINKTNITNINDDKKIKEYNKINIKQYHPSPREKGSKEIYRKIEEDQRKHKNLTSIKDKNVLFDEDEIKIVVKNISNVYNDEE